MTNIKVEGDKVIIEGGDDNTAKQIAAVAANERIRAEGSFGDKVAAGADKVMDALGSLVDAFGQRTFYAVSWFALAIGCILAWQSGKNVTGIKGAQEAFAVFAVILVIATKFAGGRWGKASRLEHESRVWWRNMAIVGLSVSALFGLALQSSVEMNKQTGFATDLQQLRANQARLNEASLEKLALEESPLFPAASAKLLQAQMDRALSAKAMNFNNEWAKKSVGEMIDHGSETFCRGSSYYKDKYCPDILDLNEQLIMRTDFEDLKSEISKLSADNTVLRDRTREQQNVRLFCNWSSSWWGA